MRRYVALSGMLSLLTLAVLLAFQVGRATAHGTNIGYKVTMAVEIEARFDDGAPMANAQVTVYAPDNPQQAWLKGETDEQGHFVFTPDPDIPGSWDVSVRTAGHGEMLHLPIEEGAVLVAANGGANPLQTTLMGVAGLWGFVGTALYFSRRKD